MSYEIPEGFERDQRLHDAMEPGAAPANDMAHRGGVPWSDAPMPVLSHECEPQSVARLGHDVMHRCACGAVRYGDGDVWADRNSRREL